MIVDRQFSRGMRDIALRLLCGFGLIMPPILAITFLSNNAAIVFAGTALMMLTMGASYGPLMAAVQMMSPPEMRGRFAALTVLASNLLGYAIGPMLIGFLTDYVFHDPMKVGYSIVASLLVLGPLSAAMVWSARGHFLRQLDE